MRERALILGNYRPSYILARALFRRGYDVICGLDGYDRGTEVSKYVDTVWNHPSYSASSDEFQLALNEFCAKDTAVKLVFPVAENFVRAFAEGHLTLPSDVNLGSMANDTINVCLNKPLLLEKAARLDIPVAPFAITEGRDALLEHADRLKFPLVVRPSDSTKRLAGKKAITCGSRVELETQYDEWEDHGLLLQEHVSGTRDNIYFSACNGEIQNYLHAKIERTDQPDGSGLALEGITIDPCPILQGYTEKLIKTIDYTGIGCVQFLVDDVEDKRYLLELNPRLAGNHALPEYAGLALSDELIDLALGQLRKKPLTLGDASIRYTWFAGEIESLRLRWRTGGLEFRRFIPALLKSVSAVLRSDLDISLNRDDWKPGFFSLCDTIPGIGTFTRARFKHGIVQKLLIRKKWV